MDCARSRWIVQLCCFPKSGGARGARAGATEYASPPSAQAIIRRLMAIAMGVAAESINVVPRPFGKLVIPTEQQLYTSADGMVNVFKDLRPVLPGHMVIAPSRTDDVALLSKLADAELTCLVAAIHEVQARAEGADRVSYSARRLLAALESVDGGLTMNGEGST